MTEEKPQRIPKALGGLFPGELSKVRNKNLAETKVTLEREPVERKQALNDPLASAIETRDIDNAVCLVARGADANTATKYGRTALHVAAEKGDTRAMTFFIDHKASVDCQDGEYHSPLYYAILGKSIDAVRTLLKHNANTSLSDGYGHNLAHNAAFFGTAKIMQELIAKKVPLNEIDLKSNMSILDMAAIAGNLDVAKYLLDTCGMKPVPCFPGKYGPLYYSVSGNKNVELTKLLIERGANVNEAGFDGKTALHRAAMEAHADVAEVLLDHGANANLPDYDGNTPLIHAAYNRHPGVLKLLVQRGANVDAVDYSGNTALHYAKNLKCDKVVGILKKAGAKDVQNVDEGFSRLHHAVLAGDIPAIRYQLAFHSVTARDSKGRTPLHIAAMAGDPKATAFLIGHFADTDVLDWNKCTPLHYAVVEGGPEAARILVANGAKHDIANKSGMTPLALIRNSPKAKVNEGDFKAILRDPSGKGLFSRVRSTVLKFTRKKNAG